MVSQDGGTLLITPVGLGHEGLYICQGSNWAGLAQAEVQVSVHGECSIWRGMGNPSAQRNGSSWPSFLVGEGSLA